MMQQAAYDAALWLRHLQVGDPVMRVLGGVETKAEVVAVGFDRIAVALFEAAAHAKGDIRAFSSRTKDHLPLIFRRDTGGEIDEVMGWDGLRYNGSFIKPEAVRAAPMPYLEEEEEEQPTAKAAKPVRAPVSYDPARQYQLDAIRAYRKDLEIPEVDLPTDFEEARALVADLRRQLTVKRMGR